jgi:ABC-2 type transport system ATP-binding protein
MIVANDVTMKFYAPGKPPFLALDALSCTIPRGCIYGMIGSNGAGKSTFLRLLAGVYRPNSGSITVQGEKVWENPAVKSRIVFVPDELYFLPQSCMTDMAGLYASIYPRFDRARFARLSDTFELDTRANIASFSKGMRRQAAAILGLSAMPDYLFFDETFDGLDPVMRGLVKQVIYRDVIERNTTTIITSHSLHELEDTCDQLALLHRGGILFQSDVQDLKTSLFKVQTAFAAPFTRERFEGFDILSYTQMGSVCTFIVRGDKGETEARIRAMSPLLLDILPLSLEEVFIYEMELLGYSFKEILM